MIQYRMPIHNSTIYIQLEIAFETPYRACNRDNISVETQQQLLCQIFPDCLKTILQLGKFFQTLEGTSNASARSFS